MKLKLKVEFNVLNSIKISSHVNITLVLCGVDHNLSRK